jgi:signal transduction histidine kinase
MSKRIVVVDDEPDIREMCVDILEEYSVRLAADGSEVAPLLAGFRPHIVITDMRMPRESGLSVVRRVKQEYPSIEVLVMTGYGKIEEAVEAMKLGASDFILKPFEIGQMLNAVSRCFERIVLREENQHLQDINQELSRLNELKEKFLRLTSHELRGPLTILQGYCDLLPLLTESPTEVKEASEMMSNAVGNLTTIVQNLTLLMSSQSEVLPIQAQPLDVARVVSLVVEEIKVHAHHRNHVFKVDAPPSLRIIGDTLRLGQILRELLFNAVKFTPDYGKIWVTLRQLALEESFQLEVQDNGIGVEPDRLGLIFESFYESHDTHYHSTSKINFMGGGLGIGLTLVRDIVNAYGGRIGITSEIGKGTSVWVTLPMQARATTAYS